MASPWCHWIAESAVLSILFIQFFDLSTTERKIDRLIPLVKRHRDAKERAQGTFWEIYQRLGAYRQSPSETEKRAIESQFDELCQNKTGYARPQ